MQQFEAALLESLQDHLAFALADRQLVFCQFRSGRAQPAPVLKFFLEVAFDAGELLGLLGLDVQAGLVQAVALGDVDDFIKGQNLQAREGGTCAIRVRGIEPAARVQGFQFGHGERIGGAVLALGEFAGDVGGALQIVVVQGKQHAILAALQIQFQVVGAQVAGSLVGGGGGFRGIERCATVGDHRWMRNVQAGRQCRGTGFAGGLCVAEGEQQAQ
ncbi:hypothetical protein D3C73_1179700 [compost metagenome]